MRTRKVLDRAVEIARLEAEARGHPWEEPVKVRRTLRHIIVHANQGSRGGQIRITLDSGASEIREYWIAPK